MQIVLKKFFIILFGIFLAEVFLVNILFAITPHTIPMIFESGKWEDDEMLPASDNKTAYITWDHDNFFLAYCALDLNNADFFLYFDTDPHQEPKSGKGSDKNLPWDAANHILPFNADYSLVVDALDKKCFFKCAQYHDTQINKTSWRWEETKDTDRINVISEGSPRNCILMSIPWQILNNPSKIYVVLFSTWEKSVNVQGVCPADALVDLDRLGSWYGFTVADRVLPTNCKGQILTFEISAEEKKYGSIKLEWKTASETDNLGYNLYRSINEGGPFEKINTEVIPGHGTTGELHSYEYIDTKALKGFQYYYYLESVSLSGSIERIPGIRSAKVPVEEEKPSTDEKSKPAEKKSNNSSKK